MVYIDDIIIFSKTLEEHILHVKEVLTALHKNKFYAKLSKCRFLTEEIEFLGHVITKEGVKTDPRKVDAINAIPIPKSAAEIRRFLGMAGYYRKFIENFSKRTYYLRMRLKKGEEFSWDEKCEEEFKDIKACLSKEPIMAYPDFTKRFILTTDASKYGLGAILSQRIDNRERVVCYASRSTNKREQNYFPTELEGAAIVWAIDKFRRPYLLDSPFTLVTDHSALKAFKTISGKSAKLERWSIKLQDVKYTIEHRPGTSIPHVDCLSRVGERINQVLGDTEFIDAQRRDPTLRRLWAKYDKLLKEVPESKDADIEINPSAWHAYVVKTDGKMYHRLFSDKWHKDKLDSTDRLVIPHKYRLIVMSEMHDKNHFGFKKCYHTMQRTVLAEYVQGHEGLL